MLARVWELPVVRSTKTMSVAEQERLLAAAIVGIVLSGAVFLFFVDPRQSLTWLKCPFLTITGLYCPGCGSTRGFHSLLHGDLLLAIRYNPFMVTMLPFLGYAFLSQFSLAVRGKRLPHVFIPSFWIWALLVAIIAYWILRNIPLYPFSILAPVGVPAPLFAR